MGGPSDNYSGGSDGSDGEGTAGAPRLITFELGPGDAGARLDKALAALVPDGSGLSRSRLAQLIAAGAVSDPDGRTVTAPRAKVKPGAWIVRVPPAVPAEPAPEAIPLSVVYEDGALIVVDKPAGMVVHPAPGAASGTLVNALLHHCGPSLTGIGGVGRPGIVHRIDKDTSGLLVVAKTEAAQAHLSALFAAHDVERAYHALVWGRPDRADPRLAGLPGIAFEPGATIRIDRPIARHPTDRKRMAVRAGGRRAVTRIRVLERFPAGGTALASLVACTLETGRTHQIRVHAAHIGHPIIGDPVYGRARSLSPTLDPDLKAALGQFPRQALHAATLGFVHPSGTDVRFSSPLPDDFTSLLELLRRKPARER